MTYAVVYLKNSKVTGLPFRCPTYSRQWFEEKKRLGIPCALMKRDKSDQKAKILDSFEIEVLEQYIQKTKEIHVSDQPLEPRINHLNHY